MSDIQNIFQELKDTMQDTATEEESPKPKPAKKKMDPAMPLSDDDIKDLEKEFLNYEAAYKEPSFTKKTKPNNTSIVSKESQTVIEKRVTVYEKYDDTKLLHSLQNIQKTLNRLDKKIELNTYTPEANSIKIDENPQPIEIVKLLIAEIGANESARYQLQTKEGIKEIALSEYYDMSRFVSMLQQYRYSMILDKTIVFENELFNSYRDKLLVISQNILANSFRFFEKSDILNEAVALGEKIKEASSFTAKAIDDLEVIFLNMKEALSTSEYQKDFYFAELLNERGFILNSITIINEMLGEYIVESARKLSPSAASRIQKYLDRIELSRTTRKAYYKFHKSAKDFFSSHFGREEGMDTMAFFPFKDSGNEEIETQMTKLYRANKMNKSNHFHAYSDLIDRVRLIRNDLAHGNNSRAYKDITSDINEVLVDFKYLAIQKNFLQA